MSDDRTGAETALRSPGIGVEQVGLVEWVEQRARTETEAVR